MLMSVVSKFYRASSVKAGELKAGPDGMKIKNQQKTKDIRKQNIEFTNTVI